MNESVKILRNASSVRECNYGVIFLFILCISFFQGCASTSKHSDPEIDPVDPHEKINRASYDFTDKVDRAVFEPVVNAYIDYVPNAAQRSIGNFYDNLSYPNVVLNSFLQGKMKQGAQDTVRFFVNSTIGMFGLFDMATHMGLQKHDEDFGQTLGVWGVNPGSYLFIPFLGPSSERDVTNIPVGIFTNVLFYAGLVVGSYFAAPLTILGAIDKRARLAGPMRVRDEAAIDPYLFVREATIQQREFLIHDGNLPLDLYYEPFQDNPFEKEPEKIKAKPKTEKKL
ncbi:VacJ family lipoprotein [Nitrosomonas sp. JL21]|uniref:MlaA family lipoprotein n=1 Tax=Nitrosomonas sp. JL21 TaxID=153949 RepID=UPI001371F960|nr:VacJ family lipoprotein [Nitrosomonas sp. JL21]MBL8498689.1 VacJ family lipoprotein [Nitrosomonas sp.]MXS77476.1 VacJ family lipoprotein [Nitrosomonas sp. JL21]